MDHRAISLGSSATSGVYSMRASQNRFLLLPTAADTVDGYPRHLPERCRPRFFSCPAPGCGCLASFAEVRKSSHIACQDLQRHHLPLPQHHEPRPPQGDNLPMGAGGHVSAGYPLVLDRYPGQGHPRPKPGDRFPDRCLRSRPGRP